MGTEQMEPPPEDKTAGGGFKIKEIIAQTYRSAWFFSALAALVVFFLIKKLIVDVARVNNHDMWATYNSGDAVLINKAATRFAYGDVVYIKIPGNEIERTVFFFQRICGLPGDSIAIAGTGVYVNGNLLHEKGKVMQNYFIRTRNSSADSVFRKKYTFREGGSISQTGDYSYALTLAQRDSLRRDTLFDRVELKAEKKGNFDEDCYPHSQEYPWNRQHYGNLLVPFEDHVLRLDSINIALYGPLIEHLEHNKLEIKGDSIFINGIHSHTYRVKQNYYFVLGDNRDNANDSRVWGYLAESNIVGKALFTLRSTVK